MRPLGALLFAATIALIPASGRATGRIAEPAPEPASAEPEDIDEAPEPWATKYFLIAGSANSYAGAIRAARTLAKKTALEFPPTDVHLVGDELSFPEQICEEQGWGYPCYVPRGRWDDGEYLSVEASDSYPSMRPGYFVVIAASGSADDVRASKAKLASLRIRTYVRDADVYMGCLH